jgi:NAD(P)-dependent dehydrogenase (short-subunit alcohol dehydrogenase family)
MSGKICIVTGSNSGIGKETAFALAEMGATVVMVVRNQEKGEKALVEIIEQTGNKSVSLMLCDMSSMASIRDFAREFMKKYSRLDVLVNNAGGEFSKREVTNEGFERTFAVDYLAPFLLTHELLDLLKVSVPSRIINVSSGLAKNGKVNFDDLQSVKDYRGMQVYSNAKLMLMMFTYELSRRLVGSGVTANVLMPGFVVYLASSDEVKCVTGKCFAKKKEIATCPASYDESLQERLWTETAALLDLPSK